MYGSKTPKREKMYSNSQRIGQLDIGYKSKMMHNTSESSNSIVRKYIDKQGKKRCVGLPALKQTQH